VSFIRVDAATYGGLSQAPGPPVISPPTPPPPDPSPAGVALAGLHAASNLGVPDDVAGSAQGDLDRRTSAGDAAAKFPANEAFSAQMIQQVVSGITAAIGGVVGGILGPLAQLPLQAMQAGESALQPLVSAVQSGRSAPVDAPTDASGDESDAELAPELAPESAAGTGGEPDGVAGPAFSGTMDEGTTPTGYLGPPPVPASSPPTTPAGAAARPAMAAPAGGPPPTSGQPGMAGMPVMPPGAMGGSVAGSRKDGPPEKRVAAPGVPNGQPVKGRLTIPPGAPTTGRPGEAKPTVVTTRPARRIVIMPSDEETAESLR